MSNVTYIRILIIGSFLILSGCGDGNGGGAVVPTVTGVASTGQPLTGTATLKDGTGTPDKTTTINGGSGEFSFDVSDRQAPFLMKADSHYSLSGTTGRANINPLSTILVAEAAGVDTPAGLEALYATADRTRVQSVFGNMGTARTRLHQKLDPLFAAYNLTGDDPITSTSGAGLGFNRLLADVTTTIDASGFITMVNTNNAPVFTGRLGSIQNGVLATNNILPPTTGTGTGTGTTIGTGTGTTIGTTGTGTTIGTGTGTIGTTIGTGGTGTTGTGTIGTTGTGTTIGTTGVGTTIGTTGVGTTIGTTGVGTTIGTTGVGTTIGTSGVGPTIGTTGVGPTIGTSGVGPITGTTGTGTGTIGTSTIGTTTGTGITGTGTIGTTGTGTTITGTGTTGTAGVTGITGAGTGVTGAGTGTSGAGTAITGAGSGTTGPGTTIAGPTSL